jgi:hypothetical protein
MTTRLIIDDFEFTGFEVPDVIPFGGAQQLAVHKLPGGSRVVDSLGRDDAPLEWDGVFIGKDALTRARFLDGYRIQGNIRKLTWGAFSYNVVIREFKAKYERSNHIPYRITCEVVEDLTTPVNALPVTVDIDTAVTASVVEAVTVSAKLQPSLIDTIAAEIKAVQAAIANVQAVFNEVTSGIASVVNLQMSVIKTITDAIDSAQIFITGCDALIHNSFNSIQTLFNDNAAGHLGGVSLSCTLNQ